MPAPIDNVLSPSKLRPPSSSTLDEKVDILLASTNTNEVHEGLPQRRSSLRLNKPPVSNVTKIPTSQSSISRARNASVACSRPQNKQLNQASNLIATSTLRIGSRTPNSNVLANSSRPPLSSAIAKRKRPGWDTKGKLEEIEEDLKASKIQASLLDGQLTDAIAKNSEKEEIIESLKKQVKDLEEKIDQMKNFSSNSTCELESIRKQMKQLEEKHLKDHAALVESYENKMSTLLARLQELEKAHDLVKEQLRESQEKNSILTSVDLKKADAIVALNSEIVMLKDSIKNLEKIEEHRRSDLNSKSEELQHAKACITSLENEIRISEKVRKNLHNEIQELKGNIRVFCRVRPLLQNEKNESVSSQDSDNYILYKKDPLTNVEEITIRQECEPASGSTKPNIKSFPFTFDKVFDESSGQKLVFEEISQLVQSALDGYRVCIFAYGQTGSGKTYTMEGPSYENRRINIDNKETMGMIPRAVTQIFSSAEELRQKGWQFDMEASFLEIYNENLRDLLVDPKKAAASLEIKHVPNSSRTVVTDLTTVSVNSVEQVFSLLKKSNDNRAVGETQCNDRSSRSHSVFLMRLVGYNPLTEEKTEGLLNLIDLAGSERLSSSGSTGDRLKETQAINKSLSCLGDVIMALANKEAHIPFRNSKLTYLLQNSLGGNSKTLMFVNVSPVRESLQETLCSLRFASKVNSCQIGTARKQILK